MEKENLYNETGQVKDPDVAHEMAKKEDFVRSYAETKSSRDTYTKRGSLKMKEEILKKNESEIEQIGMSEMQLKELKEKMKNFQFDLNTGKLAISMTIDDHIIKLELPKIPYLITPAPSEGSAWNVDKDDYYKRKKITDDYIKKTIPSFYDSPSVSPRGSIDGKELSDDDIEKIFKHYEEAINSLISEKNFQEEQGLKMIEEQRREEEKKEYLEKEKKLSETNKKLVEEIIKK